LKQLANRFTASGTLLDYREPFSGHCAFQSSIFMSWISFSTVLLLSSYKQIHW